MKQSQLVTKTRKELPKDETSINSQLLLRAAFIDKLFAGVYSYLPLGLRTLNKIENIVREEMNAIGGQEILMPALHPRENWDTTGRWDTVDVLFKLTGSGEKEYALGATHEEIVTPLVQKYVTSYKQLPQAVYQIQTKFRNEARAKSGLLRGREFRMKDMYSFHISQEELNSFYETVTAAYERIYERCGLGEKTYLTFASGGVFSKYSHEFQTVTEYGEDTIYICEKCKLAVNREIITEQPNCPSCNSNDLKETKAIEVGNIFKLNTRFSDAFHFTLPDESGKDQSVLMGCYGIGPSRVMGTIVELCHDEKGIQWPEEVAPFQVHLVSLCREMQDKEKAQELYEQLLAEKIEVLFDERENVTAGEKFADSDLIGIPVRIVVSQKTLGTQSVEMKKRNQDEAVMVSLSEIVRMLK